MLHAHNRELIEGRVRKTRGMNYVTDAYTEESTLHVECHFVIIVLHDLDKALERAHLHWDTRVLRGFADHLHDVVPLALAIVHVNQSRKSESVLTSRSKLSRTNSKELLRARMAASWTSADGSSFRAP